MHRRNILKAVALMTATTGVVTGSKAANLERIEAVASTAKVTASQFVQAGDGTRLFYRDWGAGAPVLFSHAWALNADAWEYQMAFLADRGVRCIAYDQRGCGRSDQPGQGYNMDTLADDLAVVIEQVNQRKITLVAHSMGCGVVARYLVRHGAARIARVVLIATITPFVLKTADNPEGVDQSTLAAIRALLSKDRPRFIKDGAPAFFGVGLPDNNVSSEIMQWGVNLMLQTPLKVMIETHRALTETDFRADLSAFKVPTLIIHGDRDTTALIDRTGRETARLIRGSQLTVYENAPHGLPITHVDRLNRDLLAFIKG